MATVIRLGLSTIVGVIVTLGLFYLMQYLIQGADSALTEDKVGNLVDFVRVKQEQQVETKQRKPKKPPPPDELIWGWRFLRFTLFRLYLLLLLDANKVNKVADLILGKRAICALNEVLHQVKQTQRHDDAHDS